MKEAKSMYFGGEIILASECDYNSSRDLGLKCPLCDSAVFLRRESIRSRNGNLQIVNPYFAHFPSGTPDNWDCEQRAHTKQGRERIERVKIEARNQRLRLYNKHLWDMIAEDRNVRPHRLKRLRQQFDKNWCEFMSVKVRREMKPSLSDLYTFIDAATELHVDPEALLEINPAPTWISEQIYREESEKQSAYFQQCDTRLHRAICCEVIEFLATNTGGHAFLNVFTASLNLMLLTLKTVPEVKKAHPRLYLASVTGLIAGTHWVEQIRKRLEEPEVHHDVG